ncbi:hypothetical protein BSIN_1289 [Burkholderia singularis]|uniref:Uncharacterized protein n=1 Tax=Burkholderia singularis TaxID=1503053 RepID=A0A238GYC1_9BURK|nr:hypothetical protein BSIN_1289 [Burkholderia singularis]
MTFARAIFHAIYSANAYTFATPSESRARQRDAFRATYPGLMAHLLSIT